MAIFGVFKRKPSPPSQPIQQQPAQVVVTPPTPNTVTLTIEVYEAQTRERIADARAQWEQAEGVDKERLSGQIAELEGKLQNLEPAYEAAKQRIRELEALLEREGNQLGAERLKRAEDALAAGDFDEADALLAEISAEEDLAVQRKARAEYGRGQIAEEQVRWLDAADHYKRAAELEPTYDTLIKAGWFLDAAGRYTEGAAIKEKLVALSKAEHGKNDTKTGAALNNLAESYRALGRYAEAEPLYRKAIEIGKATIGERHPTYAIRLNNLAALLQDMGRLEEAEPHYRKAMEITKATLGEGHPDYAIRLNNLAALLQDMGRLEEAEPLYRQAIEIDKATIGERHPDYATDLNNLAGLLRAMGKPDDAKPLFEQMHAIRLDKLGVDHPQTKQGAGNYAVLLREHFPDDPALVELEAAFGPDIGREGGD
ncbi:MAG: tetratricopeptide repeat protein [Pseudomonadota bacterium]